MNLGTFVVILLLILIVFFAVRSIVRDKKAGRSSCGSSCGCCPMGGTCHQQKGGQE
ncbi:MAG: FeoB-associated Cys-rich membrane protein [Eubacteriales bacterium]|nr:FeoB-associated Cys-rich membrane protein [Eubacteriales bacterium]